MRKETVSNIVNSFPSFFLGIHMQTYLEFFFYFLFFYFTGIELLGRIFVTLCHYATEKIINERQIQS